MADIIENEVICFASDHFTSVLVASIVTVISTFYKKEEQGKAKTLRHLQSKFKRL